MQFSNFEKTIGMRRLLFISSLLLFSSVLYAQIVTDTVHYLFKGELDGDAIRVKFGSTGNRPWNMEKGEYIYKPWLYAFIPNSLSITKQFAWEKIKEIATEPKNDSAITKGRIHKAAANFDSGAVIFTAYGISRKNAVDFEYRILKNREQEVLSWSPIKLFCESYVGYTGPDGKDEEEIGYLGEFKTGFGNNLTVELRKKRTAEIISSLTIVWVNRKPEVLGVFTYNELPDFLTVFKREAQYEVRPQTTPKERATKDSLLILKKNFAAGENSLLFYLDDKVRSKEITEYKLQGLNENTNWKPNELDVNIIWLKDLPPGKYKLLIRYSIQRHNVTEYEFEIEPAWHQTTTFKIGAGSVTAAFFGFIVLLFKTTKQKRNLAREQVERMLAQTEPKAIRSQLNPHFIFNSLSSIQGLINKNNIDAANHYLSEFSSLMRYALRGSEKEFSPLQAEISAIESYLRLEQLRFGFHYSVEVDASVDTTEIEVPSLLLQPLIENAVKHGVSSYEEKGKIEITLKQNGNNLLILVADNGKGFSYRPDSIGYGLKLTRLRIELLNKTLKQQCIQLNFNEDPKLGTAVHLTFVNWL
jgi:hypothetical protein